MQSRNILFFLASSTLLVTACNKGPGSEQAENADESETGADDEATESSSTSSSSTTDDESTQTTSEDDSTGEVDESTGCTPGELGCECNGGRCLGDLECFQGSCVECIPGGLDCECVDGQCLGDLVCEAGLCVDPGACIPGELDCECNGGQCLGDLVCIDDICSEMPCPNPNEMSCDGQCIDILDNDENCGDCGVVCEVSAQSQLGGCEAGSCLPFWSECFVFGDFPTCDSACAAEGKACAAGQCNDGTVSAGEAVFCIDGDFGNTDSSPIACNAPIPEFGHPDLRCCCE